MIGLELDSDFMPVVKIIVSGILSIKKIWKIFKMRSKNEKRKKSTPGRIAI